MAMDCDFENCHSIARSDSTPSSVDIYFCRNFVRNEIGIDDKYIDSKIKILANGGMIDEKIQYTESTRSLEYAYDVFFSNDQFDVFKKVSIASFVIDVIIRAFLCRRDKYGVVHVTRDRKKIMLIRNIIDKNIQHPPDVPALAKMVGVSASKMMKAFRAVEHRTIGEYVAERRMILASQLLLQGVLTIAQVSYEVGYSHPSNFTSAFKRYHGKTPREFVREKTREV